MYLYEDYWYQSQDGLNLYARDYRCKQNKGDEKTLLCIPGLTRNSADFAELAEHLVDRYRVIAVDLRGRGKSDYDSNPLNYHPGTYGQDMIDLVRSLSLESVVVIGTSLGGLIAMGLRALQPSLIEAVVVNDIGPEVEKEGMERIKDYVGKTPDVLNWEGAVQSTRDTLAHTYPKFSSSDWEAFTRKLYRQNAEGIPLLDYDPDISVLVQQTPSDNAPDLWPLFEAIKSMSMLVLRGELSDLFSNGCLQKMQSIKPDMHVAQIPDVGHAPLLTEPEAMGAIDGFLNSL